MADDDLFLVVRPSDLATLRFPPFNLEMDGTKLRRSTPGDKAGLAILLPPKHFREHPQFWEADVLDLAAGAPTGLVFEFPDGVDEMDLGTETSAIRPSPLTCKD